MRRMYPSEEGLNFHTFVDEDFLERPENDRFLREEKPYHPEKAHVRPDPERVVLLDYSYRSTLAAIDEPQALPPFEAGDLDLPFEVDASDGEDPRALYNRREDLPRSVLVLARESYSSAGLEHSHGWRGHELRELPHMIHPSELQITGVEADGTLHFFLYDKVERVRPGATLRFDTQYYWMQTGKRLKRRLFLHVHAITSVARARMTRTVDPIPWTARHLERWLGNDLAE
jgi:hypothetical protein